MKMKELLFPSVLTEEGKKHILLHKYKSGGKSLLLPYLEMWWEFTVESFADYILFNYFVEIHFKATSA